MSVELATLLRYKNERVVSHFCHHHPEVSIQEGQELFTDLLAWLWLSKQRTGLGKKTYLFGPLLRLDELWHTFILHTQDYLSFSMTYFGEYMHHEVERIGFEHVLEEEELTDFLQDCFNYLDSSWVERRFAEAFA
ncbi:glycine-rich domain-containing protein [Legionella fallonii]|uniref:Uncharacterized protein n=1 Tax=Legionella fallonii LLAP-10 TaxID=1212491 RepID=A0A098G7D2_9GAMM|nr:hypothetical protein [Legionella fallonii]CEG57911.1 conserved protein of unknown function [Legionella fallonii LLAP-10]